MGLINWCDEKLTYLKKNNIVFRNGIPVVPEFMRYDKIPDFIETNQFRNEIPIQMRKNSLLSFYSDDRILFTRLKKIDNDIMEFKKYGGIVGMDISPSVNMVLPRQLHSILINSIYDCIVALNGIKVAINARLGDYKTYYLLDNYPVDKTLVFGNLGCKGDFFAYSILLFNKWIISKGKNKICIYGTLCKKDLKKIQKLNKNFKINFFHGHNNCSNNNKKSVFIIRSNEHTSNNPRQGYVYNYILTHSYKKINPSYLFK